MMQQVVFIILSAIALIGALGVVLSRRLFRSALFLVLSFVGVAGFYILLEAGLLAMIQLLVYVGAIAILIIFAIMLSRQAMVVDDKVPNRLWILGEFVVAILAAVVIYALLGVQSLTWFLRLVAMLFTLIVFSAIAVLLSRWAMAADDKVLNEQWIWGGFAAAIALAVLVYVLVHVSWPVPVVDPGVPADSIQRLGQALVSSSGYVLPFEVASVLLLVALVGAVIIAREK
jgi:NADH-quinone oxidoreductase subunit J